MNWELLDSVELCESLIEKDSQEKVVVFFKHSNRCSISSVSKFRFEKKWSKLSDDYKVYLVDVINARTVSQFIANTLKVTHESPQLLLV